MPPSLYRSLIPFTLALVPSNCGRAIVGALYCYVGQHVSRELAPFRLETDNALAVFSWVMVAALYFLALLREGAVGASVGLGASSISYCMLMCTVSILVLAAAFALRNLYDQKRLNVSARANINPPPSALLALRVVVWCVAAVWYIACVVTTPLPFNGSHTRVRGP